MSRLHELAIACSISWGVVGPFVQTAVVAYESARSVTPAVAGSYEAETLSIDRDTGVPPWWAELEAMGS